MDNVRTHYRTHSCGELRMEHVGQTVTLAGFLENFREVGANLGFLVLRDFYGTTQVVAETEEMVKTMRPGSVIVDVAIDQGGCIETADTVTTHENPYYVRHGVLHYSVANMPGAVPRTSTFALTNATLPYVIRLAQLGAEGAMQADPALLRGLNTYKGQVTYQAVAEAQGLPYTPARELL